LDYICDCLPGLSAVAIHYVWCRQMTIVGQAPTPPSPMQVLRDIAEECNKKYNAIEAKKIQQKKKRATCQKLGQDKHKCCDDKIKEHQQKSPPKGNPPLEGEQAYKRPKFDKKTGQVIPPVHKNPVAISRSQAIKDGIAEGTKTVAKQGLSGKAARKAIGKAIGKKLSGLVFPDAAIVGPPKILVDFKFACPASHRSKKKKSVKNYRPPKQSKRQRQAHNALGDAPTRTIQF